MKKIMLKASAYDYSSAFAESHLEVQGFNEWDITINVETQTERTIIASVDARGTGATVIVSACNVSELVKSMGIVPISYSIPEFEISGFTAATIKDTIHQIAEQMARVNADEEDGYRVDAISLGSAIDYFAEELIEGLK